MNESSEAWDEYVPAGMVQVLALFVHQIVWLQCVMHAWMGRCVCEEEAVHWTEMGPCSLWIFSYPPVFSLMSRWCQLACGKTSWPANNTPNKAAKIAEKTNSTHAQKDRFKDIEKSPWSLVAHIKLRQHLGHMFRWVTLYYGILFNSHCEAPASQGTRHICTSSRCFLTAPFSFNFSAWNFLWISLIIWRADRRSWKAHKVCKRVTLRNPSLPHWKIVFLLTLSLLDRLGHKSTHPCFLSVSLSLPIRIPNSDPGDIVRYLGQLVCRWVISNTHVWP